METVIKSKQVSLIVFDSHTSCQPKKIIEGEVGDATMALQARINSTALAKLHQLLGEHGVTLVGISQLRQNIGGYGDPNVTTGGLSWKFYSDMRFKVSKSVDKINSQNKTTVEVIKNKCGVPFGKAEFIIKHGHGVDRQQEIIDLAVEHDLLKLGGAGWYTINETTKLQGDAKLKQFMADNPQWALELETDVLKLIGNDSTYKEAVG
jgi:recombination protein RecA